MELFSIVGFIILAVVVISGIRLLAHSLKFIFVALLILLGVIFVFGISYIDIIGFIADGLLWVF